MSLDAVSSMQRHSLGHLGPGICVDRDVSALAARADRSLTMFSLSQFFVEHEGYTLIMNSAKKNDAENARKN